MIIRLCLLILTATIFPGCNIQNNHLYFPSSYVPSEETLRTNHIIPWPTSVKDYRGFVGVNEIRPTEGTIVIFHGNAGTAAGRVFYVRELAPLGYRVILAEYPQYGGRKGKLGEKAFVDDGNETVRLAYEQFGAPVFLLGESLGCGVAAAVARETPFGVDGIILITPWDTLAAVAQSKFPFIPVRLLLTDTYDNIGNLQSFKGRIAVVGARHDEVIPVRHAKALYHSLPSTQKRMVIMKEAGHNNWPTHTGPSWWKALMDFVKGNDERSMPTRD